MELKENGHKIESLQNSIRNIRIEHSYAMNKVKVPLYSWMKKILYTEPKCNIDSAPRGKRKHHDILPTSTLTLDSITLDNEGGEESVLCSNGLLIRRSIHPPSVLRTDSKVTNEEKMQIEKRPTSLRISSIPLSKCQFCKKSFKGRFLLRWHIQAEHGDIKSFKCTKCSFASDCSKGLAHHKKIHNKLSKGKIPQIMKKLDSKSVSNQLYEFAMPEAKDFSCKVHVGVNQAVPDKCDPIVIVDDGDKISEAPPDTIKSETDKIKITVMFKEGHGMVVTNIIYPP